MDWHKKQINDIQAMRAYHYNRSGRGGDYSVNELVQTNQSIVLDETSIPQYVVGRVLENTGSKLKIDFGHSFGEHYIPKEIASRCLVPSSSAASTSGMMREMQAKTAKDYPGIFEGARVLGKDGKEYVVEGVDKKNYRISVRDERGVLKEDRIYLFQAVNKEADSPKKTLTPVNEAGPESNAGISIPYAAGSKVTVTSIDPALNQLRVHSVQQGNSAQIIGRTGTIVSVLYPIGEGRLMYRVLFDVQGKGDFSTTELTPTHESVNDENETEKVPKGCEGVDVVVMGSRVSFGEEEGTVINIAEGLYTIAFDSGKISSLPMDERIVALAPVPHIPLVGVQYQSKEVSDSDPVEGDTVIFDGKEGIVVGYPNSDERIVRVISDGEEVLVNLDTMTEAKKSKKKKSDDEEDKKKKTASKEKEDKNDDEEEEDDDEEGEKKGASSVYMKESGDSIREGYVNMFKHFSSKQLKEDVTVHKADEAGRGL